MLFAVFHVFFFFKQKTAYEMRISDWSSDVCSSDLQGVVAIHGGAVPALRSATAAAVALAGTIDRSRKFVHQDANRSQQLPARPGVYQRYFFSPASPRRANSMTKTSRAPKITRRHGPMPRKYSWKPISRKPENSEPHKVPRPPM